MANDSQPGRVVYMNGRYAPEAEANVSIFDSALMFGDMVFEMTRSFGRKQFKLREHLDRLYRSMYMLRIPLKMPVEEMERAVYETIERNKEAIGDDDEDRVMVNVSRGILSTYWPVFGGDPGPTLIISVFPLSWTMGCAADMYDTGVHAVTPAQRAIPADLLDPKMKNRSRLHYMIANLQVSVAGDAEAWALLLDPDGAVAEGTGSNFFLISGGELLTPEPRHILRGITRQHTMDLARKMGVTVRECAIDLYDVINGDEAFFTSTPYTILPCTKINGIPIGSGKPGPLTAKLVAAWCEDVGLDIVEQAKRYAERTASAVSGGPNTYRFVAPKDEE